MCYQEIIGYNLLTEYGLHGTVDQNDLLSLESEINANISVYEAVINGENTHYLKIQFTGLDRLTELQAKSVFMHEIGHYYTMEAAKGQSHLITEMLADSWACINGGKDIASALYETLSMLPVHNVLVKRLANIKRYI